MQNIIVKQFVASMQRKILETTNRTILTPPTFPMAHFESYGPNFKGTCQFWKYFIIFWSQPGPDGYPRVLDYSTFEFTTLPYSKNFTTQSSSRVVTISSFCPIIQIFGMGRHHSFLDNGRHVSNDVVA